MNPIPKYIFVVFSVLFSATGFAQKGNFQYKRKLQKVTDQWYKITLPENIFSKINPDFSDLRIVGVTHGKDTIEIPYLLNNPAKEEVEAMSFRLMNESKMGDRYYFTFDANESTLINEIDLHFQETNFDWEVRLEGSQNLQEWFSILQGYRIISIKNSLTDFEFTKLTFPESGYRYFRISFEAGDKPSLQAAKILRKQEGSGVLKNYPVLAQTIEEDSKLKQTILSISLKEKVPLAFVKINIMTALDYYRPISISTLYDSSKNVTTWRYYYQPLTSGILESNTANTFRFDNFLADNLKIVIENRDNQPLKIDSVLVAGYEYELTARFEDAAEYYLFYGNKAASKPDYDISRFKENIPGHISSLSMGKEEVLNDSGHPTSSLFENKNWLWGIMVIIILTLGFFSVSMIKKKK